MEDDSSDPKTEAAFRCVQVGLTYGRKDVGCLHPLSVLWGSSKVSTSALKVRIRERRSC